MTCENETMVELSAASQHPPGFGAFAIRAVWIVALCSLAVFLIFLSSGHFRLSQAGTSIVMTLVYTALISLPSIFILTAVSTRLTGRFPRLIVLVQASILACMATAGTFAGDLLLQFAGIVPPGGYWLELREALPFSVIISLIFGLSISTFETMRYRLQATVLELRTRQVEQERAYKLLAEARLSSLESRIHPHFLFNTLNSIAALIPSDPGRAEDTVGKLASLLRFSLSANPSGLVPLGRELKIVRDYLEIEKTRFGPRLLFEISIPDALADVKVPPLALQSLVENCVKHVVSQRTQGAKVRIAGAKDGGRIRLEVTDDGPGFTLESIAPDHGLGNLIARLELLFGDTGQLEVRREADKTTVSLLFPA